MKKKFLITALFASFMLTVCPCLAAKTIPLLQTVPYDTIMNGKKVSLYTITNGTIAAQITNYGGFIVSIFSPDRDGNYANLVTNYPTIHQYMKCNIGMVGPSIGRYANRIANGRFSLNGKEYQVTVNNGKNTLHGGNNGFDHTVWDVVSSSPDKLVMKCVLADGLDGFPGKLTTFLTFSITDDNGLKVDYEATTDKPTVVSMTTHSYFNLDGVNPNWNPRMKGGPSTLLKTGDIMNHMLKVNADKITETDKDGIPSGKLTPVKSTLYDFNSLVRIGDRQWDMKGFKWGEKPNVPKGKVMQYDDNFCVNHTDKNAVEWVATLYSPQSGRQMEVWNNHPGLQVYTGSRRAIALESQMYPDSPNHPDFPSAVLNPGEKYQHTCIYKFSTKQKFPFQNPKLSVEERTKDLLSRLTVEEKVGMMMNRSAAVDRLDVPAYNWWGEACHGLMGVSDVTVFPQCIGLAATFDDDSQLKTYSMVSDEARGRYNSLARTGDIGPYVSWLPNLTFWCPNVNIFRDPRWGRGQETYGEDPFLTSRMGLNVVRGMQGNDSKYIKTHACAKHYAVHSGPEPLRHKFNAVINERDLWETYLPAFRTLVKEGNVQEVMCAYSAYEGEPCCTSNRLLVQILRDRWKYKGLIVSDCDAINDFYVKTAHGTHENALTASVDAVRNGTDLECGKSYQALIAAAKQGKIDEKELDVSLSRLIKARIELGMFDPDSLVPYSKIPGSVVDCQAHRDHALLLARESQVLLKNENNILPLSKSLKKIAVLGPNSDDAEMQRGNYSGSPTHCVTILQGIKDKMPNAEIKHIKGCEIDNDYIQIPKQTTANGEEGFHAEYFASTDWTGNIVNTGNVKRIDFMTDGGYGFGNNVPSHDFTARYTATLVADFTGELCLHLKGNNFTVKVNGKEIGGYNPKPLSFKFVPGMQLTDAQQKELAENNPFAMRMGKMLSANVTKGEKYNIEILYKSAMGEGSSSNFNVSVFQRKLAEFDEIQKQIADCDAIIYVGGITSTQEGEGHERSTIELPAVQQRFLQALKETGKPVVFVNCSGSCIGFEKAEPYYDALVQAWYPGQEGGTAVADVLFGDYNPSGKLPVTFYKSTKQLPDFQNYSMENRTYRYFTGEPQYAFGYGKSYTQFEFGKAKLAKKSISKGESVEITIPVTNKGTMDGAEVVQVYVKNLKLVEAPIKALKAYKRVEIPAGKTEMVTLTLGADAFEYYNYDKDDLEVFAGKYKIMYGNSSRDEDLKSIKFEVK